MTISSYQVDSVISAYSKQNKMRVKQSFTIQEAASPGKYEDVVTLSRQGIDKAEAYQKISYSLVDVLLKTKEK